MSGEASHLLGLADAEQRKPVAQDLAHGEAQRQPRPPQRRLRDEDAFSIIVTVKFARQLAQVENDLVRSELDRCVFHRLGVLAQSLQERELTCSGERGEIDLPEW